MTAGPPAKYASRAGAAAYRDKYERSWLRRLSARRETRVVGTALARAGATGRWLDAPCGVGRMVPALLERVEHVTAVDASPAMVQMARERLEEHGPRLELVVADVTALPFDDAAFDGALCHRLLHHLDGERRQAVLAELARVVRRHVVASFWDATTWRARREARRGAGHKREAIGPDRLAADAGAAGLHPLGQPIHLSRMGSMLAVQPFERPAAPDGT